jgi:hypothetical protein
VSKRGVFLSALRGLVVDHVPMMNGLGNLFGMQESGGLLMFHVLGVV